MKVLMIGLGAGGLFAGVAVKKQDPKSELVIIDKKGYDLLSPCGLPYALEGEVENFDKLTHDYHLMGTKKIMGSEAYAIDPGKKIVKYQNMEGEHEESYDKLILDMGTSPLIPPVPGAKELLGKGVYTVSNKADCSTLKDNVIKGKKAVVVGAGAVGLETAAALKKLGMDVVLVEMLPTLLPKAVDPDISKILEKHMVETGIEIKCSKKLDEIKGKDNVTGVVIDGDEVDCHLVVMASGVIQNIDIAKDAGLEIGKFGIITDEKMQTSDPNIYALGDIVEIKSAVDGRPWTMQLAVAAYRQGIVAGTNAAGGDDSYIGALTTFVSKIGNLEVAATGFNEFFAKANGYDVFSVKAKGLTKPDWYPGAEEIMLKVIVDKKTGRVLGAQAVGKEGAGARINVMSTAIQAGFDVAKMQNIELAYCPAVSETYDVINKVADVAVKKYNIFKKRNN